MTETSTKDAPEAVSTDRNPAHDPKQQAGQDKDIARRLKENPEDSEARLDAGLDQSMDASDPPASTQPVHSTEPATSSGYDEKAEEELRSR